MKLFEQYKEWMETGMMGEVEWFGGGLCNQIDYAYVKDLMLFKPEEKDPFGDTPAYWAFEKKTASWQREAYEFTELRQTIVLLICAMNDEL